MKEDRYLRGDGGHKVNEFLHPLFIIELRSLLLVRGDLLIEGNLKHLRVLMDVISDHSEELGLDGRV